MPGRAVSRRSVPQRSDARSTRTSREPPRPSPCQPAGRGPPHGSRTEQRPRRRSPSSRGRRWSVRAGTISARTRRPQRAAPSPISPFALAADLTRTMAFYRRQVPVERQSSSSQPVTDGLAGPTGTIARARRRGPVFGSSGCPERHDRPCVAGVLRARELVPVPRWHLDPRPLLVVVRVGCLPIALWWPPFLFRCRSVAEPSWLSLRNDTGTVVAGR